MTCQSVLEALLDAEPSELAADGRTPLGAHLRGCVRCRRVASQLLADTRLLATAMKTARARRPATRLLRLSLAPGFAVAAMLLVSVARVREDKAPILAPVTMEVAPTLIASTPQDPLPPNALTQADREPRGNRTVARAFPRPVPVTPVRLEGTGSPVPMKPALATRTVTVDPPPGTRAAVLHTSNPKLVVVWLY
jgi:hypothetical protein